MYKINPYNTMYFNTLEEARQYLFDVAYTYSVSKTCKVISWELDSLTTWDNVQDTFTIAILEMI